MDEYPFDSMTGEEFEKYCGKLLQYDRFTNIEYTPKSGDQGVDIIATRDSIKYAIQCKCYSSDLGNSSVQEVCAGKLHYNCNLGVVMTNRNFTKSAIELAESSNVILWNREHLLKLASVYDWATALDQEEKDHKKEVETIKKNPIYREIGLYVTKHKIYAVRELAQALNIERKIIGKCIEIMIEEGVISIASYDAIGKFTVVMNEKQFLKTLKEPMFGFFNRN